MGELSPFVREGWKEDPIAASGAALNSVLAVCEHAHSGKRAQPLIELWGKACVTLC